MALAIVRRMSRFAWLRLLVSLAIYVLAVPGTVRSTTFASAAATGGARAPLVSSDASAKTGATASSSGARSFVDDEVRVFYCTSCGFQQNFVEVKRFLEDRYPHLSDRVYGANYEVAPMKKLLSRALGYLQIAGMVLMVVGESIFRALGLDTALLRKALDNRIGCFALILLMGSISQGLVSTGAFEVTLNGELVFSKLALGRWPTLQELAELLDARRLQAVSTS